MARPLRFIPPQSVVEVTCRTIQSRFLLRPSPELNNLLLGVLGRGLSLYAGVSLHAFFFASNHIHLLMSVSDVQTLAKFMNHFNSNVARTAGRFHGWRDRLWGRRYHAIVVADEAAQVARLRYILSHGMKEGLVARARDWPGVSCVKALAGAAVSGTWISRTNQGTARTSGETRTKYPVPVHPLPTWVTKGARWRRDACRRIIEDIERETRRLRPGRGAVLGAVGVVSQHPHGRPRTTKRSSAPAVHAVGAAARALFLSARQAFREAFRQAAALWGCGDLTAKFPAWSFRPPSPSR